ncbi:MAG: hypothetical protein FWH35_05335, partial [Treponema sp.]|nr:hypothetical protein [Treponema sp.]
LFLVLIIISCAQDSIFYNLSMEPEPKDPRIAGSPSNMAVVNGNVYVGTRMSGTIYYYGKNGWGSMGSQEGFLGELTSCTNSTTSYLYALIFPGGNPRGSWVIKRYEGGNKWVEIPVTSAAKDYNIQALYSAGGKIFAGGQNSSDYQNYGIFYYDPVTNNPLKLIQDKTSFLSGAAEITPGGDIYLATAETGIFKFSGTAITGSIKIDVNNISGIMETGGVLVAVSSGGGIYTINPGDTEFKHLVSAGVNFTGAMSFWKQYSTPPSAPVFRIDPMVVTINKGESVTLKAYLNGKQTSNVTWSITGKKASGTTISKTGLLKISASETLKEFSVKAVLKTDSEISGNAQVSIVEPGDLAGKASITGNPWLGETLTIKPTLLNESGGALDYQWKRDGVNIPSAIVNSYVLVPEDNGKFISVTITDTNGSVTSSSLEIVLTPGWHNRLLLLGIRGEGTSKNHGYRELDLNGFTGKPIVGIRRPGESEPTSIINQPKYNASLGKHPVEAILQVPDISEGGPLDYNASIKKDPNWQPLIFASTSRNGVWSLRNDEWNAEE